MKLKISNSFSLKVKNIPVINYYNKHPYYVAVYIPIQSHENILSKQIINNLTNFS